MKRLFIILAVMTAVVFSAKAERLLTDSFNYVVGNLAYGDYQNMGTDQSKWWYMTGSNDIQVVDTNFVATGYQSKPSGKAAKMQGSNKRDIRAFNGVSGNGKSVYYSFLLNVDTMKTLTSKQYIMGLTGTSTASGNAAIYGQVRLTYKASSSYQIGVTKANEVGVRYAANAIPFDSTVLVVVRYDFIAGDKNDECYMWINPTKLDESKPTTQCVQDTASGSGTQWGANQKVDPSALSICNLAGSAYFVSTFIDEVRVATEWDDLFEGGSKKPSISVASELDFKAIYQGESTSDSIVISGSNLTQGITISHKHSDITLSTDSFAKEDVEKGVKLGVSLQANTAGAQADTIVIASNTTVKQVIVSWTTYPVVNCATVADLKTAVAGQEAYTIHARYTGIGVVTRDTVIGDEREIYLQDTTGAAKIVDYGYWESTKLVGKQINGFIVYNGEAAWGVQPFYPATSPIVSQGSVVEPQEITLAELQTNGANYLLELVKIKEVTFTDGGETFADNTQYEFTQDSLKAKVKVEKSRGISGATIPAKADVIGFSLNTSGTVIVPRSKDDIIQVLGPITEVEKVTTATPKARKFIYQGMLYIERDGRIYNAIGEVQ